MPEPSDPSAQTPECVAGGYDAVAEEYARHLHAELDRKPFDRDFLDRFAAACRKGGLVLDLGRGPGRGDRWPRPTSASKSASSHALMPMYVNRRPKGASEEKAAHAVIALAARELDEHGYGQFLLQNVVRKRQRSR